MRAVGTVVALLVGFGLTTLVALEGAEVVILRTGTAATPHETRTWIAEADGAWWIEAANESRPFFADIRRDGRADVRRADRWYACRADVVPEPEGHARIRALLRDRYGWRDWWIGWLADTRASRAIRLGCEAT